MDEKNWLNLVGKMQLQKLMEINQYTQKFGLFFTQEDMEILLAERTNALKKENRVELGEGILKELIIQFCDSSYINQDNYINTLVRLQEIFYLYKNEVADELTDDELLNFMKEQFETICYGDLDYLEGTCLEIFAQAIRAGYRGYQESDGRNQYSRFDEVRRWDKELYMETLKELCWS